MWYVIIYPGPLLLKSEWRSLAYQFNLLNSPVAHISHEENAKILILIVNNGWPNSMNS